MKKTPKSLRLQIGLFGRTNVGKSSFLNFMAGQHPDDKIDQLLAEAKAIYEVL
jgi:GTP-binding protein EngB required for normal cell division